MTATGDKKISTHVRLSASIRTAAIEALGRGESLTEFIEKAMLAEVERRKGGAGTDTPGPAKLIRGKRPKPSPW